MLPFLGIKPINQPFWRMSSIKTQAGVAINQNIGISRHFSGQNPLINHYGRSRHPSKHRHKSPFLGIKTHQSTILAEVTINQTTGRSRHFFGDTTCNTPFSQLLNNID